MCVITIGIAMGILPGRILLAYISVYINESLQPENPDCRRDFGGKIWIGENTAGTIICDRIPV